MTCFSEYLFSNFTLKKGERGAESKLSEIQKIELFKQRYFNEDGIFPSYRCLKTIYNDENNYLSHESIRQIINNVIDSFQYSEKLINLSKKLNLFFEKNSLFSINDLKLNEDLFNHYELPKNVNSLCEILNIINSIANKNKKIIKTVDIDIVDTLFVYESSSEDCVSYLKKYNNKLMRHVYKYGYISLIDFNKYVSSINKNYSKFNLRILLDSSNELVFFNKEYWILKNITGTKLEKKINIISSFYYLRNNINISFKLMINQLQRSYTEKNIPLNILSILIKTSSLYENNEFIGTLSKQEVIDSISHTEKLMVEVIPLSDKSTFTFEELLDVLKHYNRLDEMSLNSLRVYMSYSSLLYVQNESNKKIKSDKLTVSLI